MSRKPRDKRDDEPIRQADEQPRPSRRRFLLRSAQLTVGGLLTIGCSDGGSGGGGEKADIGPELTSNPKGSWYDAGGYDADSTGDDGTTTGGDDGAAGDGDAPPDDTGIVVISNPKGSWYDDAGYTDAGELPGDVSPTGK